MARPRLDIRPGDKFGQWEIVRESERSVKGSRYFWCRCVCGNQSRVFVGSLRNGASQSCGCKSHSGRVRISAPIFRFGPTLSRIIKDHGLSYVDVARRIGGRPPSVTNYVYGLARPGPPVIIRMADAIDATPEERHELHLAAARDRGYQI